MNVNYKNIITEEHDSYLNAKQGKKRPYRPTVSEEEWIVSVFPNMKNREIADKLGTSESTVIRIARKRGIYKSHEFMLSCMRHAAEIAGIKNHLNGPRTVAGREKGYFKKGSTNLERLGKEREAERIKKSAATLRETLRKERMRVAFGLPQRTKRKIGCEPRKKLYLRWYLKKRGYILDEDLHIAFYNEATQRALRIEKQDQTYYRFEKA